MASSKKKIKVPPPTPVSLRPDAQFMFECAAGEPNALDILEMWDPRHSEVLAQAWRTASTEQIVFNTVTNHEVLSRVATDHDTAREDRPAMPYSAIGDTMIDLQKKVKTICHYVLGGVSQKTGKLNYTEEDFNEFVQEVLCGICELREPPIYPTACYKKIATNALNDRLKKLYNAEKKRIYEVPFDHNRRSNEEETEERITAEVVEAWARKPSAIYTASTSGITDSKVRRITELVQSGIKKGEAALAMGITLRSLDRIIGDYAHKQHPARIPAIEAMAARAVKVVVFLSPTQRTFPNNRGAYMQYPRAA